MRTIVLILVGCAFAVVLAVLGRFADRRTALAVNGAFIFIVCWTAFTFGDFFVSIFRPGHAPLPEFGKHVAIFVAPVAAALFATRKSLHAGLRTAPAGRPEAVTAPHADAHGTEHAGAAEQDERPRRTGTSGH